MRTLWLVFFFLLGANVNAQNTPIDSLKNLLHTTKDQEGRNLLLTDIIGYYISSDLSIAAEYGMKMLAENENSSLAVQAQSIYTACRPLIYSYTNDNLSMALEKMESGYQIAKDNDLVELQMDYCAMLGALYGYFNQPEKAIALYQYIIENPSLAKDSSVLSASYNNLGRIFQEGQDLKTANKYYKKAVSINRNINDYDFLAVSLSNLASVTEDSDSSLIYLNECIELSRKNNLGDFRLATFYSELGELLLNQKASYQEAKKIFQLCLQTSGKAQDLASQSTCLAGLGVSYYKLNRMDSAIHYLKLAVDTDRTMQNDYNLRKNLRFLAQAFSKVNQHADAYHCMSQSDSLSLVIYNTEKANSLAEYASKFETLEKENKIAKQELQISKSKAHLNLVVGLVLAGILAAAFLFFMYRNKQILKQNITSEALKFEQKEKQQMIELDEMKMQFFTNVSHELKTPLTLISGPLEDALKKTKDESIKPQLVTAHNNAERLNELINETLNFRKLEKSSLPIEFDKRYIAKDLRRIYYSFLSLAESRDIHLEEEIDLSDDLILEYDLKKLEKILNNLISNAIKFSDNQQAITFASSYKNNILTVQITDYGHGIAEEEQDKIFNRFYQAKHNLSGHYGGTGIGLAFAKELAELMNGEISVNSQIGEGSTFIVNLPMQQVLHATQISTENDNEIQAAKTYIPYLINGQKPEILIVEDNLEMQDYLLSILQEDFRCQVASDGYEAIKNIQTHRYHLICSDVMMPNMDGFRLKEKINENVQYKNIPFIFLTARSLEEDKLLGLRLGTDDYITKPFNAEELKTRINNLLQNYQSRQMSAEASSLSNITESFDIQKLKAAETIVLKNLSDSSYKISHLAQELHYSQRQLARVIQQLTGMTPVNFMLELRLQRAYHLIQSKAYSTLSEVKDNVGIESNSYFSRKFKERFGISPSSLIQKT